MNTTLDQQLAHALFRFIVGLNFFMHGAVRIFGNLDKFVAGVQNQFKESFLPPVLVHFYAMALPFAELGVGLLLLVGLWTRWTLVTGFLIMSSLLFGMASLQKWDTVVSHMVYAACFFLLLYFNAPNRFSLDYRIRKQ